MAIQEVDLGKVVGRDGFSPFGVCTTAGSNAEKLVTIDGYTPENNSIIAVRFTNSNTVANPKLNVNGTGAKYIRYRVQNVDGYSIKKDCIYFFARLSNYWYILGYMPQDTASVEYGLCMTDGATQSKEIQLEHSRHSYIMTGTICCIYFQHTNTAENPTFNLNNEGDYPVYYNDAEITTNHLDIAGHESRVALYVFDGASFVFLGWSYIPDLSGFLPLTGGVLSDNVRIEKESFPLFALESKSISTTGNIELGTHNIQLNICPNNAGNDLNVPRRTLYLKDNVGTPNVQDALIFQDLYDDGSFRTYRVFGEHNVDRLKSKAATAIAFSYAGTGTYGADNPNTLTFNQIPKFAYILCCAGYDSNSGPAIDCFAGYSYRNGAVCPAILTTEYQNYAGFNLNQSSKSKSWVKKSSDGKTISWYNTVSALEQYNASGYTYYGFAFY